MQVGGVIYSDSADKAARFIMDCNQTRLPIVFLQDVTDPLSLVKQREVRKPLRPMEENK